MWDQLVLHVLHLYIILLQYNILIYTANLLPKLVGINKHKSADKSKYMLPDLHSVSTSFVT